MSVQRRPSNLTRTTVQRSLRSFSIPDLEPPTDDSAFEPVMVVRGSLQAVWLW